MKSFVAILVLIASLLVLTDCATHSSTDELNHLTLWYQQPAQVWDEALPVGNGRLGFTSKARSWMKRIR